MHARLAGLIALATVGGTTWVPASPRALVVGSYVWHLDDPRFGGWSGIDFSDNGTHFRAISDAGYTLTGAFSRDRDGAVTGVEAGPILLMRGDEAEPLSEGSRDAEDVAVAPDGSYYVSFERDQRVSHYRDDTAAADIITYGKLDLSEYPYNSGLETLALAADGTVYAIPEVDPSGAHRHKVYMWKDKAWSVPFTLPEDGFWRPVSADFGPDGRLYLLERDLWGLVGFMSRIRRLTMGPDGFTADEVLFTSHAGMYQNLEGLSVWTDAQGAIRLTTISDDNYLFLLRTEIVDFRIVE